MDGVSVTGTSDALVWVAERSFVLVTVGVGKADETPFSSAGEGVGVSPQEDAIALMPAS